MTDGQVGSNSNSWLGGVLNSLEFNGGASSGSFQSGQISNASGPVGSGTSWSPPSPPDDNEMERARKLTQQSSSVEQYEEQGGEEKGSHVYWAGPPGVVPPRKGSLTDHSVPRRLLAEYANSHPEITEAEEAAMKAAEGLRSASADQTDAANGEKRASDISPGGNSNAAIKANFEYMEEYLEEIMKDDINPTKLEALETALRKNSVAEPGSGKNTLPTAPTLLASTQIQG
ncbi:hypothetical protein BC829DRAFT_118189 [Chytridium lagenaria]|nr:hypothetical protein BC829DRAFT_118189 [Chytridium lagenaria]